MKIRCARVYNKQKDRYTGVLLVDWDTCCEQIEKDLKLFHIEWIIVYNKLFGGIKKIVGFDFVNRNDIEQKYHKCPYCWAKNEVEEIDEKDARKPISEIKFKELKPF